MAGMGSKVPGLVFKDLLTVHDSANDNEGLETNLKRVADGEGVQSSIELSSNDLNIVTHDGNKGLRLSNSLVTAGATKINQLTNSTFGGTSAGDVVTIANEQSLNNKTLDGGTF